MVARCWIATLALCSTLLAYGQSHPPTVSAIETMMRGHHTAQALQAANSALSASPRDANLWALKGIALSIEGKRIDALSAFDHALHIAPDNMAALRGEVQLLDQDDSRRTVPLLHRILALSPHDTTAHEMLALFEEQGGNCKGAIAEFHQSGQAIAHHPASLEAYGSCLQTTGSEQQAIAVFRELANRFPQLPYAKYDLALVLCDAGEYHRAVQVMQPAIQAGTASANILSLASEAYDAIGNTPMAVKTLRDAIVLTPRNINLYNRFAELCFDHENYGFGIKMMNAGLHFNPEAASLYLSRGLFYAQLSQFAKAQTDFTTAERLDPRQGISSYAMDVAELEKYHFDAGHSDAAVKALRSQIKLHPGSYLLHYLLAKLLTMQDQVNKQSDLTQAKLEAEAAVRLKPNFVPAYDLLTIVNLDSDNFAEAAEQSRRALQYEPNDRAALYHLIAALRHSKRAQDQEELRSAAKRLATLEKNSLQDSNYSQKLRLIESPSPPSDTDLP